MISDPIQISLSIFLILVGFGSFFYLLHKYKPFSQQKQGNTKMKKELVGSHPLNPITPSEGFPDNADSSKFPLGVG